MKLFCFGLGYTARHLINYLSQDKWHILGTRRKDSPIIFDGRSQMENAAQHLAGVTHLLISIAPDADGSDPVLKYHSALLRELPDLVWVGYLSATSVYGDHGGAWVDENTPCEPTGIRGQLRRTAEELWLDSGLPVHLFRLGGIYGPDRNQINAVQDQKASKIIKRNHYFSRVHVDDIVSALYLSMNNPDGGNIYNIVDDMPATSAELLDFLSDQLGLPDITGIPYEKADISDAMKSFYRDNKRVKNHHAKRSLNWSLEFPDYRKGYLDLLSKL